MRRWLVLSMVSVLGLGILIAGCGGSSDSGTNSNLAVGDTTDPAFVAFREGFSGIDEEFTQTMLDFAFVVLDTVSQHPDNPGSPVRFGEGMPMQTDSVMLTWHDLTDHWYFYAAYGDTDFFMEIVDSTQFLQADTVVQWPDSALLSGIRNGVSMTMITSGDTISLGQWVSIDGDIPNFGDVTINGSQRVDFSFRMFDSTDTFTLSYQMTATFTDIDVNLSELSTDACPPSGQIAYVGTASVEATGDTTISIDDTWHITMTFTGTQIAYVFENSTTRWAFTEPCGVAVKSPYRTTLPEIFR